MQQSRSGTGLDRSERDASFVGDFLLGISHKILKVNDLTQVWLQSANCFFQADELQTLHLRRRTADRYGGIGGLDFGFFRKICRANKIQRDAPRNDHQPSVQSAFRGFVAADVAPDFYESVLQQIFGIGFGMHDFEDDRKQGAAVAVVQLFKGTSVARLQPFDEYLFGKYGC